MVVDECIVMTTSCTKNSCSCVPVPQVRYNDLFAARMLCACYGYNDVTCVATTIGFSNNLCQGAIHLVRTHKFPDFRPPPLYAHIMTSLWKQYIGVRKALDPPPPPFGPYVLNEWPPRSTCTAHTSCLKLCLLTFL